MSRIYTASFTGTLTNAGGNADLFSSVPATGKPMKLRGLKLGQQSEVGDAAEEGLAISIQRMTATVTEGDGTVTTPIPDDVSNTAYGGTCEMMGATVATTSGATTVLERLAWNIRSSPFETYWPDVAYLTRPGEGLIIRSDTTPADDITISVTVIIEEI